MVSPAWAGIHQIANFSWQLAVCKGSLVPAEHSLQSTIMHGQENTLMCLVQDTVGVAGHVL